jgi:UDP:flavonoid glycosyltransferase YjiC (YdhE family)
MTQTRPRRILFIGEVVTLAHMARPLVLARSLGPEEYDILLACDPRYSSLTDDLPVQLIPLRSIVGNKQLDTLHYRAEHLFDQATLECYVTEDLRLLRQHRPDVVVGDMRHSLAISARLAGVPYVNVMNAHWSPHARLDFELPEYPLEKLLGEHVVRTLFRPLINTLAFSYQALPFNIVRQKYGLPPVDPDLRTMFSYGDYTVHPDLPELVPTHQAPANYVYIGPILWSPAVPLPSWWDALPSDRPIVYVNFGSSGPRLLRMLLQDVLAHLPITVVAGTAGRADLDQVPPNVYLADFLPGIEVARRADLTICSGGSMPVQQSLCLGTPVLCISSNLDQIVFSKAVAMAGAGEHLHERHADPAALRALVECLLSEPGYRRVARRLQASYEQMRQTNHFKELIDRIPPLETFRRWRTPAAQRA